MLRKHPNMPDFSDGHDDHSHEHAHEHTQEGRQPLLVVGTDAEARTALDVAASLDVLVFGVISDDKKHLMADVNDNTVQAILGTPDADTLLRDENIAVLVAATDIGDRRKLARQVRLVREAPIATIIHALAAVSPYSKVGMGCVVNAGSYIGPNAAVANYNLIGANVTIEADASVGDLCTLQSGVCIGRGAALGDEVFVGNGAIICAGVAVGEGAIIAPGSVVQTDVPSGATVMGNPAVAKKKSKE